MPVCIRYSTGVRLLSTEAAVRWAGQEGRRILADNTTREVLPIFLANWDKTYESTQCGIFLFHLEMYVEQLELLRGVRDLGERILSEYYPQLYLYVGIGRSPAPLIAYFQNHRVRTLSIPLSDFRPRNDVWSIADDVLVTRGPQVSGQERISPQQKKRVLAHFGRYFPMRPARTRLLLIDYTQTAQSLVAAQEQLQAFFVSNNLHDIEVHALALCRDSDYGSVRHIGASVGRARSPLRNPLDWWYHTGERQVFAQRWHALAIAGREEQTRRQALVMRALSGQGFDALAEHGSFPILSLGPGVQPTRYTGDPTEPAAYDVLKDELDKLP
jgi:hypothetical protein